MKPAPVSTPPAPRSFTHRNVRLTARLRRYFIAGLATLVPIVVTIYLLIVVFQFVDGLLGRFINRYWLTTYGYEIPGLGLTITILLVLAVGILSSHFFGQWIVRGLEDWFSRLPLIRRIYPSIKQLGEFFFAKEGQQTGFRRVVLIQYPRPGVYSIAFVTNESDAAPAGVPTPVLTLLIPTPPSPLTGPIVFAPQQDVIPLTMSVEDAFKLVVSGGVVAPPLEAAKQPVSDA